MILGCYLACFCGIRVPNLRRDHLVQAVNWPSCKLGDPCFRFISLISLFSLVSSFSFSFLLLFVFEGCLFLLKFDIFSLLKFSSKVILLDSRNHSGSKVQKWANFGTQHIFNFF